MLMPTVSYRPSTTEKFREIKEIKQKYAETGKMTAAETLEIKKFKERYAEITGNKSLEKYAEDGAPQLRTGELRTGTTQEAITVLERIYRCEIKIAVENQKEAAQQIHEAKQGLEKLIGQLLEMETALTGNENPERCSSLAHYGGRRRPVNISSSNEERGAVAGPDSTTSSWRHWTVSWSPSRLPTESCTRRRVRTPLSTSR